MLDIIPVCMRDNRRPGRVFRNNNSHSSRKNNDDDHWNGDGNRNNIQQQQVCDAAEGQVRIGTYALASSIEKGSMHLRRSNARARRTSCFGMHGRTYYVEWEEGQAIPHHLLVLAGLICNVVRFICYSVSWRS